MPTLDATRLRPHDYPYAFAHLVYLATKQGPSPMPRDYGISADRARVVRIDAQRVAGAAVASGWMRHAA